jgi:hypothetical protein
MARTLAKAKRFPISPASPWLAGALQSCPSILAINWVFQGMRGMQRKELSFRLGFEILMAWLIGAALIGFGWSPLPAIVTAVLVAHSLSFTANGQIWVAARYCAAWHRDPAALDEFLADTIRDLRGRAWLSEAVLIGSIAGRGHAGGPRADLDLRLVFPPGFAGWLRTNGLLLLLRWRALLRFVPLDLYAYDSPSGLRRFDQRETLGVVLDRGGRIAVAFPDRARVDLP